MKDIHPRFRAGGPAAPSPTVALLRLSVILSGLAGFSLGVILLFSIAVGRAAAIPFAALAQAHGQVQALGFVGLFVFGTAAQLFPSFLTTTLRRRRQIVIGGVVAALGLVARVIGQPLELGPLRDVCLAVSAAAEAGGFGLCLYGLADLPRRSVQPMDLWRRLSLAAFGCLVLALALNAVAIGALIAGREVVPVPIDSALIELELWGFGAFVAFAVGRKVLPRFLLLEMPDDRLVRVGTVGYGLGVLLAAGAQIGQAEWPGAAASLAIAVAAWLKVGGVVEYLRGIHLYSPPTRPSSAPGVTEPARFWLRIAFAWLVLAAGLAAVWSTRGTLLGADPDYYALGAARHALGQGFYLTLIVALGARILPGFSAWAIVHPRFLGSLVAVLTLGATLRVVGEVGLATGMAGSADVASLGGALGVLGFLAFAAVLVARVGGRGAPR